MMISPTQLIKEYGTMVSSIARRYILKQEIAEEAVQEVWYEILKNLHQFKGESKVSTWLYTVARRTILRYAKNERIYTNLEITENFERPELSYDENPEDKVLWVKDKCDHCLTAFCHCLDNEARLIFIFRYIANLSYADIAEICDKNEDNVRKRASRSKAKVSQFMNDNCIIYNPQGSCKCRIRSLVYEVNLHLEYQKIVRAVKLVDFYRKFDRELPRKNFWEKFL
jgi:RNA polymerase sigma factor (sigma-70 family)